MATRRELTKSFSTDKIQKALSMFWVAKPSGVTTSHSYDVSRRMAGAAGGGGGGRGVGHGSPTVLEPQEEAVFRVLSEARERDDTPSIFEFDFQDMMGGRTGFTCVRHTLCVLNTFMWIVGCSMLGAGIWLRLAYGGYASLLHQYSAISADSLCLAAGVITFILAFCGCCGSWFQSRCMLITYFSLVVVVFSLQLVAGTLAFAFRAEVSTTLIAELQAGIRRSFNETADNAVAITWNHLQTQFECCGVEGPRDWYNIAAWPHDEWVPRSCCIPKYAYDPDCGKAEEEQHWFRAGCYMNVKMWFIERLHLVGVVGLIFAFVQLFGMIASMLLFCTLGHKRRSHTYKSYHSDT